MNILNLVNNRVENYTIILSNRSFQHYGQLTGIKFEDTNGSFNLASAQELSFKVYKHKLIPDENIPYKDIETFQEYIWEKLVNRKLIYVKELDEYYQIKVSIDDANETIKIVQAKTLCESELSQLYLHNIEINTEDDRAINGETVFYNSENPNRSLLHRILKDKAPHYTIKHVDPSLCNLARTFTLSVTEIYGFMSGECSEQFDCLFKFNSKERGIYVYDLLTVCQECGERGDFTDKCPKCESKNLKRFGKDTPIYVDKTNLTDAIHLEVDSDSIKNCFKLEAGDEEMTATVRSINPNGTDYLFYISDADKEDMPEELKQKLNDYDSDYQKALPTYQDLTLQIRDLRSDILYYKHSMMPKVEYPDELVDVLDPKEGILYICNDIVYVYDGEQLTPSTQDAKFYTDLFPTSSMITAKSEAEKLTKENLNPVAVSDLDLVSPTTVNSTLKNYAKVYVKTSYVKLEIDEGATYSLSEETGLGVWNGRFKVTSYSDEEEIAYSEYLTLEVNDNHNEQMLQKVLKRISENDEENSIFDVLAIDDLDVFKEALGLYSLSRLESFHGAIDAAKITMFEAGQGTEGAELYESLYLPYRDKLIECEKEINTRQTKIDSLQSQLDTLIQQQSDIQASLNLQNYLGDLYPIFCSYRREDTYSNSNFISDGLDNVQMIERAKQFWELAQKEIKKASQGKCTITASLYNLLVIPAFKPLVEYFELGNRIRIKVDGVLYTLMLIGFSLNFGDLNTIEVTFSTATKINTDDFETQIESVISSTQQMATSYDYVQKQAEKAKEIDTTMKSIVQNGLDSSLVVIKNNENEEVTQGKFGILLREKDDITGGYSGKQCRLTHNSIIYTDSNWETAKCALGEHNYSYYDPETNTIKQATGYGLTADFVQANTSMFSPQIIAGDLYSEDYNKENGIGSHISLKGRGEFNFGKVLRFDGEKLRISGEVSTGSLLNETEIRSSSFYGGYLLIGDENKEGTYAEITEDGVLNCNGANIYGNINAIGGSFSGDIESTATISGGTINGSEIISNDINTVRATHINDGTINIYGSKNGLSFKAGSISTFKKQSDTDYDGFCFLLEESADALCFGIKNSNGTFSKYYYINNGYNTNASSFRHIWNGDGAFYGSFLASTGYFDSAIVNGDLEVLGDFKVFGTSKSRVASTENYNERLLYCYEMPNPMFGDIGEGKLDETGKCYIFLDDIFAETIDTDCKYQVFLQPYNKGECYVTERTSSYFIVEGTENLSFGWELKAIQLGNDTIRLEKNQKSETTQDYAEETYNYLIKSLEE